MEIKDYLHLYLGSRCKIFNEYDLDGWEQDLTAEVLLRHIDDEEYKFVQPLLRQLSSMTEEEAVEFADILGNSSHLSKESKVAQVMEVLPSILYKQTNIHGINWIRATTWLLSKGFDLFNLIENNLAIDLETIKQ